MCHLSNPRELSMPLRLVLENYPGKANWRCDDCGWESEPFPKEERRPAPVHHCDSEDVLFDPDDE